MQVWSHVKRNNLQDPQQKRVIRPDAILAPFVGSTQFEMFKLGGLLKGHIDCGKKLKDDPIKTEATQSGLPTTPWTTLPYDDFNQKNTSDY